MDAPKKPEENVETLTESDLSQVVGGNPVVGETNFFKSIVKGTQIETGTLSAAEKPLISGE
jgi:bacteriocin-like protein